MPEQPLDLTFGRTWPEFSLYGEPGVRRRTDKKLELAHGPKGKWRNLNLIPARAIRRCEWCPLCIPCEWIEWGIMDL